MEFVKKILDFFKDMEKGKRTRLIILSTIVIVIIVVASVFLTQKSYSVLYSGLNPAEAGEVITALQDMEVSYQTRGDSTIMVESSQVDAIRMQLAAQGHPTGGGTDFGIFGNASGLGTTDMEKQVYLQFQLQENLRRNIVKMDKIKDAAVIINLSEESPFVIADENKPATTTVVLEIYRGQELSSNEVNTIYEFVSKSVAGLQVDEIRIVDSQMRLYQIGEDTGSGNIGSQFELEKEVEVNLQNEIVKFLLPAFGEGRVIAQVNVVLEFDSETIEEVVFAPPVEGNQGIIVSLRELSESVNQSDEGGVVGIDPNGASPEYLVEDEAEDSLYSTVSKEMNMEVNETIRRIEKARGTIKYLSISVLLDSKYVDSEASDKVKKLVATGVGVGEEHITVERFPFTNIVETGMTPVLEQQNQVFEDMQRSQNTRYFMIAVIVIAILIFLNMIIRTFVNKDEYDYYYDDEEYYAEETQQQEGQVVDVTVEDEVVANIDFKPKNKALDQVGEYIDSRPEDVAQLLRKWLYEDDR